jgi:methionyl aminopeptidase
VVHGIPSDKRILKNGDIVSIDVGVKKNGYYGDGAHTFEVGEASEKKRRLMKVTEESLYKGISQAIDGNTVNDISCAIQNYVEGSGFGVVRELVGHGIGKNLHEEPAVPNFFSPSNTTRLRSGMVIAIEPMVNYGSFSVHTLNDGWTVVTSDGEPSAHYEHTICITDGKPEILTL